MSGEKTEEPTEKKLEDARDKGESPKSQDVNTAASMMTAAVLLNMSPWIAGAHMKKLFAIVEERLWTAQTDEEVMGLAFDMAKEGVAMVLPYVATSIAIALIASFAQVGFKISFDPLSPNFDKVNPGSGIKKLFSVRSIIDFIKMVGKAIALGWILYAIIEGLLPLVIGAATQQPAVIVDIAWAAILKLMIAATIVFIVLGPLDWGIQIWLFKRDQKMSKDEVKREYKEMEGDPEIKGKRKQLAQELANSAPEKRVPNANVVVTNPTHYAVALRYEAGVTPLPVVVAKGHDAEAALIRALAARHHVPLVSNPPLARALYKLPLDEPIPEALFEAVAAVLRWTALIDTFSDGLGAPSSSTTGKG